MDAGISDTTDLNPLDILAGRKRVIVLSDLRNASLACKNKMINWKGWDQVLMLLL